MNKVHYEHPKAATILAESLKQLFPTNQPITFLCIGTDLSTGDSLGPLVGTFLSKLGYDVLGTLDNPVHAMNVVEIAATLNPDNFIVAIDASLSTTSELGYIRAEQKPLKPGNGVGKDLPAIGNLTIAGER
jgi:putative sporulation protein YyaC